MIRTGFLSSGCSPKSLIIDDDILPGFASAISVIALFNPIENISSTFSKAEDCSKLDKLSTEYAKCTANIIKNKTSEKIKDGKKRFSSTTLKDKFIKFKNSKSLKEFIEKK